MDPDETEIRGGDALEAAFDACLHALESGEAIDLDGLCARHPEAGPALRERLAPLLRGMAESRSRPDAPAPVGEGVVLGGFRLLQPLGRGAMGAVWIAEQESLQRRVALKVMRPEIAASEIARARFVREARAVAKLRHDNVVSVFAAGEQDGVAWLAMELVEGTGLDQVLREEAPLPVARALRIGSSVALALHCAHEAGIIHRDVKPSNIRVRPDGRAVLLDFGIAKQLDVAGLTRSMEFHGTPLYASPEQVRGRSDLVDGRSDVYSLGVVLYQCLTGVLPVRSDTMEGLFHDILHQLPTPPRELLPALSRDAETVLLKALEKDRELRYASAAAFAADLQAVLELRAIQARPPTWVRRARQWAAHRRKALTAVLALALALLAIGGTFAVERLRQRQLVDTAVADGRAAASAGDLGTAGEAVRRALALRPDHADALRLAADVAAAQRRTAADAALQRAEDAARVFLASQRRAVELEQELAELRQQTAGNYVDPATHDRLQSGDLELRRQRRQRDETFFTAIEAARNAQPLCDDPARPRRILGDLYLHRWREADRRGDGDEAGLWAALLAEADPEGDGVREVQAPGRLTITSTPSGVEVHLFRYQELAEALGDGDRRLVPVPLAQPASAAPGTSALRVTRGAGDVETGALLLEVAGVPTPAGVFAEGAADGVLRGDRLVGVVDAPIDEMQDLELVGEALLEAGEEAAFSFAGPGRSQELMARHPSLLPVRLVDAIDLARGGDVDALVWQRGGLSRVRLPAGLDLLPTAAPLPLSADSRSGDTPIELDLAPGSYLAVLRHPGFEDLRLPFLVERRATCALDATLWPTGTTPAGFTRVARGTCVVGGDIEAVYPQPSQRIELGDFCIQVREVSIADYLLFLNDPATQAIIAQSDRPCLYPRTADGASNLLRADDGVFSSLYWKARESVSRIDQQDAMAYAAWLDQRERERGSRFHIRLPHEHEWEKAARGVDERLFPWGNEFSTLWCKNRLARPVIVASEALRFPVDESPYGVLDLAGNMYEWTLDQPAERFDLWVARGGAWNQPNPAFVRCASRNMAAQTTLVPNLGVRLVAIPDEAP